MSTSPSEGESRRRSWMSVWPEPFVEALAFQVAAAASLNHGRLAAAQSLFNIFQVCSTWRAISRSELLWQNLSQHVWNIGDLQRNTWREEYIYWHRTFNNFRRGRHIHATLHAALIPSDVCCCRLALSEHHLAAGFSDGAVGLFYLPSRLHVSTFYPQSHGDRLGRFSSSVSGIILSDVRLVFATLDGDIHTTTIIINGGEMSLLRRAHIGDVVNDGALVDFTGSSSNRWWVGLYAGVPGRAFHIWNSETEELMFVGGTLTDTEAVMGWHLLTEITTQHLVGRVRVTSHGSAVAACTSSRVIVLDLQQNQISQELTRGCVIVGCFDCNDEAALIIDRRGTASMRRLVSLEEEVCRFRVRGGTVLLGCVNSGYGVVVTQGGVIRVWEIQGGDYLYHFRERIGECNTLVCDQRYVVASTAGNGIIHVWDFGPQ